MTVYVDSSAALKLIVSEPESESLVKHLDTRASTIEIVSSILLYTEAHRVARREHIGADLVDGVLARISLVSASDEQFLHAGSFPEPMRSLDALHVAAALDIGASEFITYDHQQAKAATSVGLTVISPGRS